MNLHRLLTGMVWLSTAAAMAAQSPAPKPPDGSPLPGTAHLQMEGDITSQLVEGVDCFLLGQLDKSLSRRAQAWKRDVSSPERYSKSLEPNRQRLAHILGVRDARIAPRALELIATTRQAAVVGRSPAFQAFAVRWPVLGDVHGEGLLLVPRGPKTADVIAIPDADQTPEMLAGLTPGIEPASQFARRLAESGCRVLVPVLVSRDVRKHRGARMTNREFVYRAAYEMGRHVIGYEVQKVLAGVDWFSGEAESSDAPIGVIGWGEGGLVALAAAALDPRIDAACVSGYFDSRQDVWREPLDRNVFGLLAQFGDAELASMLAPRTLIIEAARGPEVVLPPGMGGAPGRLVSPDRARVDREAQRAKALIGNARLADSIRLVASGAGAAPFGSSEALTAFLAAIAPNAKLAPEGNPAELLWKDYDPKARQERQVYELDRHNQRLLTESPDVRKEFFKKLDTKTPERFQETIAWYRTYFYDEVIGRFDDARLAPNVRSRKAYDELKWTGYEVVMDVFPDVIAYGILLVPKDLRPNQRRPVVVCQHGLEGRPQHVIEPGHPAYNQYAARLAEEGFVTFAPQNLYIFGDRFRTLQRKANPLGKTLFSIIVPQHQQIVDWLAQLPFVDPQRIGFYGLSYGGKTAMRVPPLVPGYCLSICSADFNEWIWKNVSTRGPYSYMGTGEYEIFEFDLGNTFNYAEMAALIAPRPFMVERGHFDGVAPDETVAYEFAKVRHLYQARLGIGDRCHIEWFVGPHSIHGRGTFEFLRRWLRWPE